MRTSSAALLVGSLLFSASPALAQSKFAVIDMRRAVLETEEGLRVQSTLKKLFDQRQAELDAKQRQLAKERDDLDKEALAGKTAKEQLAKKAEGLQKKLMELQSVLADSQKEMSQQEQKLTEPIYTKVMAIVRRIAGQEGFDMVVDKASVPYFRSDLELTDRTIQLVNGGDKGEGAGAKPAAPKAEAKPAAAPKK